MKKPCWNLQIMRSHVPLMCWIPVGEIINWNFNLMSTLNFVLETAGRFPRHLNITLASVASSRGWPLTLTAHGRWWCHSQAGEPMATESRPIGVPEKLWIPTGLCGSFFFAAAEVKWDTSLCPRLTKFQTTHVSLLKLPVGYWCCGPNLGLGMADKFIGFSFSLGRILKDLKGLETCQCRCFHSSSEPVQLIALLSSSILNPAFSTTQESLGALLTRCSTNHFSHRAILAASSWNKCQCWKCCTLQCSYALCYSICIGCNSQESWKAVCIP